MTDEQQRDLKWRTISYIPQGSMHVLNPVRRIRDTFHDFISAHRDVTKKESFQLTAEYLRDLGLPEKVMASYPHQLSGGMRQRVTIALATILWPKLIFADEPTTALDVVVQRGVIQMLKDVQQKEGSTLVLITHDIGVHANLADRIGILYAGKLVEESDTQTISGESASSLYALLDRVAAQSGFARGTPGHSRAPAGAGSSTERLPLP